MNFDIEHRLRAADPAQSAKVYRPSDSSVRKLLEATMNTPETSTAETKAPRRPRWIPAVAAAAAVSLIGVATFAFVAGNEDSPTPAAPETTMHLALPSSNAMTSCIAYSVEFLADMPIAFSGQVVEVSDETVVLEVDKWYRGGDATNVELTTPDGEQVALNGVVDFAVDKRYLVTASEGTVNTCGFTAEWSPEMAADFEAGFQP